jgi:hypothetical protein
MTTVKELIEELSKCDQDAIVLYAFDENAATGVHDFIDSNLLTAVNVDGSLMVLEDELVILRTDTEDDLTEDFEIIKKKGGILKPAIKLFYKQIDENFK